MEVVDERRDPAGGHGTDLLDNVAVVDVLTPQQLDTLGDIAEAITRHLETEHQRATRQP